MFFCSPTLSKFPCSRCAWRSSTLPWWLIKHLLCVLALGSKRSLVTQVLQFVFLQLSQLTLHFKLAPFYFSQQADLFRPLFVVCSWIQAGLLSGGSGEKPRQPAAVSHQQTDAARCQDVQRQAARLHCQMSSLVAKFGCWVFFFFSLSLQGRAR